ncbi:MAG: hypothetical protein ACRD1R_16585 [Acidobacteriota bacterium]
MKEASGGIDGLASNTVPYIRKNAGPYRRNPLGRWGVDLLDSTGTIEEGKLADLVLLDSNPVQDIRNTQEIAAVVLRGRLLERDELAGMLVDAGSQGNDGPRDAAWNDFKAEHPWAVDRECR